MRLLWISVDTLRWRTQQGIIVREERYANIMTEFESLLRLGRDLSAKLAGHVPDKLHLSYADSIYTKLLCHAISLHKLSPQTGAKPGVELWDVASACALARCVIEAHDVLGYMVFSNVSTEERDFRILLWDLHDNQRRSKILYSIESKDAKAQAIYDHAAALLEEITTHSWYRSVPSHLKKKITSKDAPSFLLSQREMNAANHVSHTFYTNATMWLSQYVHTFPISIHQLNHFKAGTPDALHLCAVPIQYTLGFLSKSITGMISAFPQFDTPLAQADAELLLSWCAVVSGGVKPSS